MRQFNRYHLSTTSRLVLLALGICLSIHPAQAQGTEPSLDLSDTRPSSGITPMSDLTTGSPADPSTPMTGSQEFLATPPVPDAMPESSSEPDDEPTTTPNATDNTPPTESTRLDIDQPDMGLKPPAQEVPAVQTKPKFSFSDLNPFRDEKAIKPISYSPLPGIAIFPVIKHGNETAFGDLPVIFAREYAERMELKVPDTKIYHPVYTVEELRMQGLGHVYDQIMSYYLKAGRPEPTALDYLLKQLGTDGHPISRVVFVEADLDMFHPDSPTSVLERVKGLMTDDTPKQMRYFVHSRLQIFDTEKPNCPMVWAGSWTRSIKTNQFNNVTPSVFADSDSQQAFAKVSRDMSREIVYITPKAAYMEPQYDTSVQGNIVPEKASSEKESAFPNLTEAKPASDGLSNENKQAIQRILQRQNAISP